MIKKLLELRNEIKRKKPTFLRQDAHKFKKLGTGWKKARGLQSKIRLAFKGYRKKIKVGYGSPKLVKNLDKYGLKMTRVVCVNDFKNLDPKMNSIQFPKTLSLKKRMELSKIIKEKGFKLLNFDVDEFIQKSNDKLKLRKQLKKEKQKKKLLSKKNKEKASKEKPDKEKIKINNQVETKKNSTLQDKSTNSNNKEVEKEKKKEKDKIITKRV